MKQIKWIAPWETVTDSGENLSVQLQREISEKHDLYGRHAKAIGRRVDCDDVLFLLDDDTLAVVHLTWSGRQNQNPRFPWTYMYSSVEDFVENAMLPDAKGYRGATTVSDHEKFS